MVDWGSNPTQPNAKQFVCANPECRRVIYQHTFNDIWYAAGKQTCSHKCQRAVLDALKDAPHGVAAIADAREAVYGETPLAETVEREAESD